ncbi:MAG: CBS domain-containing protein [Actinomycetota bacterium]
MVGRLQAAEVLREHGISSVVVKGEGVPSGIVTERDFVSLVAEGLDPATTKVGERMTRDLATVQPRADIAEAAGSWPNAAFAICRSWTDASWSESSPSAISRRGRWRR